MLQQQAAERAAVSGSSGKSSKRSTSALAREARREALYAIGVLQKAARVFARNMMLPEQLVRLNVAWAEDCLADEQVTLSRSEWMQLALVFPQAVAAPPAVASAGGRGNVPLGAQTPQQPVPVAQELKAYYFYECATAGCKCPASHNGGPNKACSRTCRDAFPCSGAAGGCHVIPAVVP